MVSTQGVARSGVFYAIWRQLCPRCRQGRIFKRSIFLGFPAMNQRCPVCDLKFEREGGYFLGAMYISYGLALVTILVLAAVLWGAVHLRMDKAVVWALILFVPFIPSLTLLARVLWIHLDQALDPEK
jgi:uncharacterized protein (DUF983 family)